MVFPSQVTLEHSPLEPAHPTALPLGALRATFLVCRLLSLAWAPRRVGAGVPGPRMGLGTQEVPSPHLLASAPSAWQAGARHTDTSSAFPPPT